MEKYDKRNENDWKKRVATAKAIVDSSPPKLLLSLYHRPTRLFRMAADLRKILMENKKMLTHINTIYRTRGGVVSHWDKGSLYFQSNEKVREAEAKKITNENLYLYHRLKQQGSIVPDSVALRKDWQKKSEIIKLMSKHPVWYSLPKKDEILAEGTKKASIAQLNLGQTGSKRPRCYFDIRTKDAYLGRIVMELYDDYVPKTARNFLAICAGLRGLTYKKCPFHRIRPGLFCMGGDITKFNGTGGTSVYGEVFPDENFKLQHGCPGVVSMANTGPNTNNSQFILTFSKLYSLNGKHVVIGKVVQGLTALLMIQEYGSATGKPVRKVYISKCGVC